MTASQIELLAPAGSMEALRAAIQNGANAVYLGGKAFSARQYASNFDFEQLAEGIKYAHLHGVRVYVTVNTLIANGEIKDLIEYLYKLYLVNVDALIIQDLGVAYALKALLPEMEIHASTQMTIHNSAGVRFLQGQGFDRVVLAREVSLENIEEIGKTTTLPLETFVHGALCVSYSGQCLMSSMIGGRSGNRGRCAQPCRLSYKLVDDKGREQGEGYLLSPRDLKMIEHLPELLQAGIVSLKVEGRMKRPEYVATVIRNYRKALDIAEGSAGPGNDGPDINHKNFQKELTQVFNRDFTTGYFLEKPGKHLMSYQRPNNRGLRIGRVVAYDPRTREVTVLLEEYLQTGDGYEIWVTVGGRIAGEIKSLKQGGRIVKRVEKGEVTFNIEGKGSPRNGDRVFKTHDVQLMEKAQESYRTLRGTKYYPLDMHVKIELGQPVIIEAIDTEGNTVRVQGKYRVEQAEKHPINYNTVLKQMERLGNTIFVLGNLSLEAEDGLMVPVSELNSLRREIVDNFETIRLGRFDKKILAEEAYQLRVNDLLNKTGKNNDNRRLTERSRIRGNDQIKIAVYIGDIQSLWAALESGADIIYFGGERLRNRDNISPVKYSEAVKLCKDAGAQGVLVLPRLYHQEKEKDIVDLLKRGKETGVDGYLVGNPGALQLALEMGLKSIRGDYTLNVFNDLSIRLLEEKGLCEIALSPEMRLDQIEQIKCSDKVSLECIVHGNMPLMITEHCLVGNILGQGNEGGGCSKPCLKGDFGLQDRLNMVFPLKSDEDCRMHVFNPKTLCLLDRLKGITESGINTIRIEARKEDAPWVKTVVKRYRQELRRIKEMGQHYDPGKSCKDELLSLSPAGFTTGHYYRGVL